MDVTRDCFGCGTGNAAGLGLRPETDGVRVFATLVVRPEHRGFRSVVHGGILATAFDEVIAYAVGGRLAAPMVTLAMDIEFRRPVLVGERVEVRAWWSGRRGRFHFGRGEIVGADGGVRSVARAKYIVLPEKARARFVEGGGK